MATFHDRTAAPVCQRGLLRAAGPCVVLTSDEVIALTADALELPTPPLLFSDTPEAVRNDLDALLADHAHAHHLRRQLECAAEHGAALLASLGLPRLVTGDFIHHDTVAVGDALNLAIATLDALDGNVDLEDGGDDELSLGWEKPGSQFILTEGAYSGDRELDTADAEPSLASPERHPEVPAFAWGPVYTARGGSEGQLRWAEGARDDREMVDEDGDDLDVGEHDTADRESYLGWPEDVGVVMSTATAVLTADPDAEHNDADAEQDERHSPGLWLFGPSRQEAAHA